MARKSKIEEYGLESFVDDLLFENEHMPHTEIAKLCSIKAKTKISNMAIKRYLEAKTTTEQKQKKEVILADRRRVLKTVNQEFDIIQTNLDATRRLLERFELVDDLPQLFKEQMDEIMDKFIGEYDPDLNVVKFLENWQIRFEDGLRRKVGEIAVLNREIRENMKLMVTIREKAFHFELIAEYISLFMEIFKDESKDGSYERSVIQIASNPRMKQLADQLKSFAPETGGE